MDNNIDFYVDFKNGNDSAIGDRDHPLKTLEAAKERGAVEVQIALYTIRGILWNLENI